MKHFLSAGLFLLASASLSFSQPLFAPPVNLGPKINTSFPESDPFWDAPRKRLYFLSARDGGSYKMYFSDWTDTGWTDPVKLGPQINTGGEFSPSVTPDGQKLYFVADARQGYLWDIWVSTWDSTVNDWGTPANVGYPVNTYGVEFSAHLAPSGQLFFSSSNDGDSLFPYGRYGIYSSEWNGSSWSVPQLQWGLGQDPQYPSVPANGWWLYFNEFVSDGISIFAVAWSDSGWELPAYDLRPQIGGRSSTPFITPSGDSLFFRSADIGGFGGGDIFLLPRVVLGDLNLDGLLTSADVVLELKGVFLGETFPAPFASADGNCDGQLKPADVILLLNATFLGAPFPCRI